MNAFIDYWLENPQQYKLAYLSEHTTGPDERLRLQTDPTYTAVLRDSLETSEALAVEVGGKIERAKLASDLRFMLVSGSLHARIVNQRYPWSDVDLLRAHFLDSVILSMEHYPTN